MKRTVLLIAALVLLNVSTWASRKDIIKKEKGLCGMHISIDMQFDTLVVSASGSNSMTVRSVRQDHGDHIVSIQSFIYDHDGEFCIVTKTDSSYNASHGTIVHNYECKELKDTVYVFDGTPLRFGIPVSQSSWTDTGVVNDLEREHGVKREYTYDGNGHCVLEKTDNGHSIVTKENSYNLQGDLEYCICCINDTIDYTLANRYGRKGRIRKQKQQMYGNGCLLNGEYVLNRYKYDIYGRLKEAHEVFYCDGNAIVDRSFTYRYNDTHGTITMRTINHLHTEGTFSDVFRYYSVLEQNR